MLEEVVTLKLPEGLYQRLFDPARVTKRSIEEVMLRALKMGAPPVWDDVPAEFQAELAAMDRLDDETLWEIARGQKSEEEMAAYDVLLEKEDYLPKTTLNLGMVMQAIHLQPPLIRVSDRVK